MLFSARLSWLSWDLKSLQLSNHYDFSLFLFKNVQKFKKILSHDSNRKQNILFTAVELFKYIISQAAVSPVNQNHD